MEHDSKLQIHYIIVTVVCQSVDALAKIYKKNDTFPTIACLYSSQKTSVLINSYRNGNRATTNPLDKNSGADSRSAQCESALCALQSGGEAELYDTRLCAINTLLLK